MMKNEQIVPVHTEYIKLEQLLKLVGAVSTGGEAKERILAGQVLVNGEICTQRGKKLRPLDQVSFEDILYKLTQA